MIRFRHFRMAWRVALRRFRELHPIDVQATLLNACNLRCVYCRCPDVKTSVMTTEQWRTTIGGLASLGMMRIKFQGGEPTMRPDFNELTAAAKAHGVTTALITNGMMIPGRPTLLDHLDELIVSLDSSHPDIHERQRGTGTWAPAVQTIDLARGRGLRVYVNMVLTSQSVGDLEAMLDFCEQRSVLLNAQPVMFDRQYYDSAAKPIALTEDEIRKVHQRLADWKRQRRGLMFSAAAYENVLRWSSHYQATSQSSGESSCMAGRDYIHIEANGDVHPCVQHGATFTPKNILRDGLIATLRHVQHHNCGDCWTPYLNERKFAFGMRPQALLEIVRRG